jgi:two-component system cell cycle sensor histidine kinase/response regulator CckA
MTDTSAEIEQGRGRADAWYRRLVVVGLALSIVVGIAAFLVGQGGADPRIRVPAYLILPVAIALAVAIGQRRADPWFLVLASILIDVEALLVSVLLAMGLALAVLFPLIGLALLLDRVTGRALVAAFLVAGVTGLIGVLIGLAFGPVSKAQLLSDPLLVAAAGALFMAFGVGHLFRLDARRAQAVASARAELASRRATEAELDRTSQLLVAIIHASPVPTQVIGANGRFIVWNLASERVFGWSAEEVVGGDRPPAMTPDDEQGRGEALFARAMAGEVVSGERMRLRAKDGRDVWVDVYGTVLQDRAGKPVGIASQLVDVTDRVSMEASLLQAAKMEAIGGLAGGIAHDFNNILTAIRGHAELVRLGLSPDLMEERAGLDEIIVAADKAAGLTRQLLAFARRTVLEPRVLDPAEVVVGFAPMLRRLLGEDVELVLELAPDIGRIKADPVQLEQVILNLAANARDAMPSGGTLRIAMANAELTAAQAARHSDARPGSYLEITVADTGTGMDETVQRRAFEPFFTTKEPGKGTGMGLATVFGIVRMSDGWIDLRSEPGHGATFRLYFPRVKLAPAAEATARKATATVGGNETILLVEDDPAVRAFSRRCLADLGYTVIEATNGRQALKVARAHDGPIDLLLSDIIMPGIQGPDLAQRLARARPGIRTLLCSGFAGDRIADGGGLRGAYLPKPYSVETLARAVRTALDRPV